MRNNPENLGPRDLLKRLGKLSNDIFEGKHPGVLEVGLADGTFAGSGELSIDDSGCVVLTRIADNDDHLGKGWAEAGGKAMIETTLSHGGGMALPTSGFADWKDHYGSTRGVRTIGTFRIPVKDICEMAGRGDAMIGNIGEGEIILNPNVAKSYLSEVEKIGDEEKGAIEISL